MLQDIKTSFGYYYHISEPFNCHSIMKRTLCTTHTHTHTMDACDFSYIMA